MDNRNRMIKSLVCLAMAMTGTSVFLGWICPSTYVSSSPLAFADILEDAERIVSRGVQVDESRWLNIELFVESPPTSAGAMLAALPDNHDWHFQVDLACALARSKDWERQDLVGNKSETIRIRVIPDGAGGVIPVDQWLGVRALVTAISRSVGLMDELLPVRFAESTYHAYGVEAGAAINLTAVSLVPGRAPEWAEESLN